jgi:triacylglycerol lipase
MTAPCEVIVVGAGAAGLTAAIGLARAGVAVTLVERHDFSDMPDCLGSGFPLRDLAHPAILGPECAASLPWERRLVERGLFAADGEQLLGLIYRDPDSFRHWVTIDRAVCHQYLARRAVELGVTLRARTAVESLIREKGRVIGVCTEQGPLYAHLVFLAEGDGAQLVAREGYERSTDPRDAPTFMLGITRWIELPPGAVEERFGLGEGEGAVYELLLRNPAAASLNLCGFVSTRRQGVLLGLLAPREQIEQQSEGGPARWMDWFEQLPALAPWLKHGQRGAFGIQVLRGGGVRDLPHLVEDGLVIGGAASALSTDFPWRDHVSPATRMGLLLVQAVDRIRAAGGRFSREELQIHYLETLQQTDHWKDAAHLHRWPGYLRRTHVLFEQSIDLALGSAQAWTQPRRGVLGKGLDWLRLLGRVSWSDLRSDASQLARALRLGETLPRPSLGARLFRGAIQTCRGARASLPSTGTVRVHYTNASAAESSRAVPWLARRWFRRLSPVLAAAGQRLVRDGDAGLPVRLREAGELLLSQLALGDVLGAVLLTGTAAFCSGLESIGRRLILASHCEAAEAVDHSRDEMPGARPGRHDPLLVDPWEVRAQALAERLKAAAGVNGRARTVEELRTLGENLAHALQEFDAVLADGPPTVDGARAAYLEMLARHAAQLGQCMAEAVRGADETSGSGSTRRPVQELTADLAVLAEQRSRRTWEGQFAWAAADGRQLRLHHLARLSRYLDQPDADRSLSHPGRRATAVPAVVRAGRTPRHPLVFCHGMLAMSLLHLRMPADPNYFSPLQPFLQERGIRALFPRVAPTGGVVERARDLRAQITAWTREPVNLIAHSMGGLDARYLVSRLNMADQVQSVTTIATPHQGTSLADWFVEEFPQGRALLFVLRLVGLNVDGFRDCRVRACRAFNAQTPDAPGVRYFSYGAAVAQSRVSPILRRPWTILRSLEGPNDGLVSARSARWGEYLGTVGADHFSHAPRGMFVRSGETFDALGFCSRLIEELARRGF